MNQTKPHRNRFLLTDRPTRLANFKAKRKAKATGAKLFLKKHISQRRTA